jgi:hypothetical protein
VQNKTNGFRSERKCSFNKTKTKNGSADSQLSDKIQKGKLKNKNNKKTIMKFKDFKRKLIGILILSVAFVIGMNAQKNCQSPVCYPWQNTDNLNIGAKLDTIQKTLAASGGGGTSLRQSTLDSIKDASYYSGIGSSQANLISAQGAILNSVLMASLQSLDSLKVINEALHYGGDIAFINTEGNNNTNACAISLSVLQSCIGGYSNSFIGRHGAQNTTKSVFWDAKDSCVFTDNNLVSVFKTSYGNSELDTLRILALALNSYADNTKPSDTLLTSTSYTSLVSDLNTFYSNPGHQAYKILQESHSNAVVGSTLTFYCVIRYKP